MELKGSCHALGGTCYSSVFLPTRRLNERVHPLDVSTRLEEFKDLEERWPDRSGPSFDRDGLDWLSVSFESYYPEEAQLPYTYPTEGGNVRMEWCIEGGMMILEVSLSKRQGEWRWFEREAEVDFERTLDMDSGDAWVWLALEINPRQPVGE